MNILTDQQVVSYHQSGFLKITSLFSEAEIHYLRRTALADRAMNKQSYGCLQVIRASHLLGRLDHTKSGDQTGADWERVQEALRRLELIYCEMAPGDALFFHCNLLHRSDQNKSPDPRWSMVCCYNKASNSPYKEGPHPAYTPLKKVEDSHILPFAADAG